MFDLTPFIEGLIAVATIAISLFVLPWLKSKTTANQRENLLGWAEVAVAAAQQLYHQCSGAERLKYALELLADQGYDINTSSVRDAVEAAVLKLHQSMETSNV